MPSKRAYKNYSFYTHQQVEEKWLSPDQKLAPETLCWVLQSKGKRRQRHRGNKRKKKGETSDEGHQQQQQRKELLSRAWVVGATADDKNDAPLDSSEAATLDSNSKKRQDHEGRILVRYPKGSTYHVKRENLLPVLTLGTTAHSNNDTATSSSTAENNLAVVVLPETNVYRRWAVVHTRADDAFCEIGCDVGILVQRVHESSSCPQHVWGLDKSVDDIQQAQERYPHCQFRAWNVPLSESGENDDDNEGYREEPKQEVTTTSRTNQQNDRHHNDNNPPGQEIAATDENENPRDAKEETATATPSSSSSLPMLPMDLFPHPADNSTTTNASLVVAIDINGNRELEAVQQCIRIVIDVWRPRLIIVKSRALHADLAANSSAAQGNNGDAQLQQ